MTDRELMQEALYALTYVGDAKEIYSDTIESLRARLAQPEEPDWAAAGFSKPPVRSEQWWKHEVSNAYAQGYEKGRSQREWKGLADEEMRQAAQAMDAEPLAEGWQELNKFARAIEAKLKEKNT